MKGISRVSAAVACLGVAAVLIGTGGAMADPNVPAGGNTYDRPIQGVGSDTTEGVMNGLSETLVDANGNKLIASYNALSTSGFTTKGGTVNPQPAGSNCTFQGNPGSPGNVGDPAGSSASSYVQGDRPNGSGNGLKALNDSWLNNNVAGGATQTTHGCIDFARSSSKSSATTVGMTDIPFAEDAVSFAITGTSGIPRQLSKADLVAIYTCQFPGFNNAVVTNGAVTTPSTRAALLPQAGSGTRKFFLGALGIADPAGAPVTASNACLSDQKSHVGIGQEPNGTIAPIEEHKGNVLDQNSIVPISIAQYIAQSEGVIADVRGLAILGTVVDQPATGATPAGQFSLPMSLNNSFGTIATNPVTLTRQVYNIIPTQVLNTAAGDPYADRIKSVFVGSNSQICSQGAQIIQKYGFGLITNCGDTSYQTAGQ